MNPDRPLRILSLDGGGVRGIATLYVLREIMAQVSRENEGSISSDEESVLRPCDYFDLICGTSTGGLIAIMLGRLRYTVEDAIERYLSLAKEVFTSTSSNTDALFDHRILEERMQDAIVAAPAPTPGSLNADASFKDADFWDWRVAESEGGCRVFVVTVNTRGIGTHPTLLRTYRTSFADPFPGRVWEAARATSAAPTYFSPIIIDHIKYGDGGLNYNNPTRLAINEAHEAWPDRSIGCLVSLGTGEEDPIQLVERERMSSGTFVGWAFRRTSPHQFFRLKVAEYCAKSVTSCAKIHEEIQINLDRDQLRGKYFRINVPALGKIDLAEWEMIGDMIALATSHMESRSMRETKIEIARIIRQRISSSPYSLENSAASHTAQESVTPNHDQSLATRKLGKKRAIDYEEGRSDTTLLTGTDFHNYARSVLYTK